MASLKSANTGQSVKRWPNVVVYYYRFDRFDTSRVHDVPESWKVTKGLVLDKPSW